MSEYYPAGSMKGSGIYAEDITFEGVCNKCDWDGTVEMNLDDWGTGVWTCPRCHEDQEERPEEQER